VEAAVAAPEIKPVEPLNESPAGSAGEILQVVAGDPVFVGD
jgi:hypothetical protein